MSTPPVVSWEVGNDFLLECGSIHEPYRFCVTVLEKIRDIVPYDQALFLMLDGNRKVTRSHFIGFSDRWMSMYLNYYSKSSLGDFGLDREVSEIQGRGLISLVDWHEIDWIQDDFIANYIRPRRLSQSLAFTFFDLKGSPATSLSLDRLVNKTFSREEIDFVTLATAHLGNLYKNMFVRPQGQVRIWDRKHGADELTQREKEVLDLLCQGVKPAYIARELRISLGTTNKHIAHIYKKLGVDSKQELLVKILGK
ncbi:MAG: helix-turn-helix transcriptional regulator [Atopobiaceae bacterium]|nr:helix-turn-helix transcriptional regulator [Atopobiaceae bacterium]